MVVYGCKPKPPKSGSGSEIFHVLMKSVLIRVTMKAGLSFQGTVGFFNILYSIICLFAYKLKFNGCKKQLAFQGRVFFLPPVSFSPKPLQGNYS